MRPSQRAWIAFGVGILAYDVLAKDEETLSEQVYRWDASHPILTYVVIEIVHRHLTQQLPADPIHWLFLAARWTRTRFGATRRGASCP